MTFGNKSTSCEKHIPATERGINLLQVLVILVVQLGSKFPEKSYQLQYRMSKSVQKPPLAVLVTLWCHFYSCSKINK